MKYKIIGSWFVLFGLIALVGTVYFFPPEGVPGSYSSPLKPSAFFTPQQMMTMSETVTTPREFYIETDSFTLASQATDETITPMTFKQNGHYRQSYVYIDTLTQQEYASLAGSDNIIGIWDVPEMILSSDYTSPPQYGYGNMSIALSSTNSNVLTNMGYTGQNTITVIIDEFPPESVFYTYFPSVWSDRVIHYPSDNLASNQLHGVMTAGVAASVSPDTLLYLMAWDGDPVGMFQTIIGLRTLYPEYDIISSNSYSVLGGVYHEKNHVFNRKIVETVDNGVIVVFAAGNWARPGDHPFEWTTNFGYDPRAENFNPQMGYPNTLKEVISVGGSHAYNEYIVSYSSPGRGVGNNDKPDICAPTHFYFDYTPYSDGLATGTSTSCPFMAGVIANVLSGKTLDVDRLIGSIHTYSTDRGKPGYDTSFGFGVVNAENLFENYDNWIPTDDSEHLSGLHMYSLSFILLGIGIVVYNKQKLEKILKI